MTRTMTNSATATVAAYPMLNWVNARLVMYQKITRLAPPGPPDGLVATATLSHTWNEPTPDVTSTNAVTGRRSGKVMSLNEAHSFAPSILAASYSSLGMACNPAKNRRVTNPVCRQVLIQASEGMILV